ncbi:HTH-type transcriptional regulator AcrR [Kordia sp. SMS9]|uniref:TetR/AcrR family transcriptional regulator n=1 Tax=Kordia sp. SMS9 TaxID=2282170 RepID=UPI000E0D33B8|nr:TetR/AcrR family transcriptional regulator [Kordia sp. SMS9]AXG70320.1 HTH-type transcriptional regulator AcrR [Kordia sp. SMS9]
MTDKQEKILQAALELFSNEGYNATSTSKIGKKAGVSEGLIFRHFTNKKGLLDAIIKDAESRIADVIMPIITETDPKTVLKKAIELPFSVKESEFDFWRLQFKLKWEVAYNNPQKMQPLIDKLAGVFEALQYENPNLEAILLNQIIESISSEILKGNLKQQQDYKSFLLHKYKL